MSARPSLPDGLNEAVLQDFVLPTELGGNASAATKELVAQWFYVFRCWNFARRTGKHLKLREVSIQPKLGDSQRKEAQVVVDLTVTEDMLNSYGKMHGGCIMYLVDIRCSTLPVIAMSQATDGNGNPGVSQNINIIYHAPASPGDELKLITTSTTMGARTMTASIEIWDVTHHRLVASATQVKMAASQARL
ncbi:HotDog domain-containing protein [Hygrophoropsis aurantiaca]|uniref:HotDog domain-containing protein n=1 Tax=Hygrophoropsis aurantiaca TaxID=72124 RepID=A0ACB8AHW6_9AGAM|nr:HotDog domain-containing protein [Hygrophoropsis aurantiaca]